jgi:hypothetical protein
MCLIRTLKGSLTTVDVTAITFGGSATPTFSATGIHTSDVINAQIDALHDYYICFTGNVFGGTGALGAWSSAQLPTYPALFFGGNLNGAYTCSTYWAGTIGAGQGFSSFNGTPNALGAGSAHLFLAAWVAA